MPEKIPGPDVPHLNNIYSTAPYLHNGSVPTIEAVLNSGMNFIAGLFEMATGKKMDPPADGIPMIRIDRKTGDVTMKFRLPGF